MCELSVKELLRLRVTAGDTVLQNHLETASSRATYISKTVQNELITCCGEEILSIILKRVEDSRYFSILFDETTDVSHTSQLSLTARYVHDGAVREDFLQFLDPHQEAFGKTNNDNEEILNESINEVVDDGTGSEIGTETPTVKIPDTNGIVDDEMQEPKLTGEVLGKLVLTTMKRIGLSVENCVGIGTDGCSVMASKVCGAVTTIQSAAINAVRCPCFNHALNLSLGKTSSVQSVRNAVGTIKDVVAFFNASAKRNFIMKRIAFRQLQSLCETRWIERHDAVLHFCSELSTIVRALRSISRWDDTQTSSKASSFAHALCSCEFIVSIFALCDV